MSEGEPMARFVVAIDQGTTGTTVLVFDETLRLRARGYREFEQHLPKPGWVEHEFTRATGLVLDPYFSGTKLQWLLDNVDGLRARADRGEVCFGTVDSYLVWRLTGGAAHVTDVSNASRTLLFDLHALDWSARLCDLFTVPRAILPSVRGSAERYGETRGVAGLRDGITGAGMSGGQQAALFGPARFNVGDVKWTYGTGPCTAID